MRRTRTQDDGYRVVEEVTEQGWHVKVVVAYVALEDAYAVHLYIGLPGQPTVKVWERPRRENHIEDGLDMGFSEARDWIKALKSRGA